MCIYMFYIALSLSLPLDLFISLYIYIYIYIYVYIYIYIIGSCREEKGKEEGCSRQPLGRIRGGREVYGSQT